MKTTPRTIRPHNAPEHTIRRLLEVREVLIVEPLKRQPLPGESVIKKDYGFIVGMLRDSENAWRDILPPYQPGDVVPLMERWQIRSWISEENEVQVFYEADLPEKYWAKPVEVSGMSYDADCWIDDDFERTIKKLKSAKLVEDPDDPDCKVWEWDDAELPWRPARTMPDWAIRLRPTCVSVECRRVNSITTPEAIKTGWAGHYDFRLDYWEKRHKRPGDEFESCWAWFYLLRMEK